MQLVLVLGVDDDKSTCRPTKSNPGVARCLYQQEKEILLQIQLVLVTSEIEKRAKSVKAQQPFSILLFVNVLSLSGTPTSRSVLQSTFDYCSYVDIRIQGYKCPCANVPSHSPNQYCSMITSIQYLWVQYSTVPRDILLSLQQYRDMTTTTMTMMVKTPPVSPYTCGRTRHR